jgi:hypothetical protein
MVHYDKACGVVEFRTPIPTPARVSPQNSCMKGVRS